MVSVHGLQVDLSARLIFWSQSGAGLTIMPTLLLRLKLNVYVELKL